MKKIIAGILAVLTVTGGGVYYAAQPAKVKVQDPLTLKWERPATDAEWNDDVKLEYVDIRGTKVLGEMLEGQKSKLKDNEEAFAKYRLMESAGIDPVKVLYVEMYQKLKEAYPDISESDLAIEALSEATKNYSQQLWEIEKNKQSIERIEKELELRKKGYVKIKGDKTPTDFFGAELPEDRVRTVID